MAPAEHRTAVPCAWTFIRTVDGWVLAPFLRPWPVSTLVRWVLRHGAHETFGRAQERLRQTVSSALRSPVSVGTRVTVSLESSGLLMVESLDPALLPYPSRLANGHVLRQDANDGITSVLPLCPWPFARTVDRIVGARLANGAFRSRSVLLNPDIRAVKCPW